jgi:serine/threonine protein kinase
MKVISVSKSKFEQLEPLKLSKETFNTEGNVYEFNYRGNPKVLKRLFHQSGTVFANKLFTLEMLDTYKDYLPDNFYIPDSLISVDSTIEGFTVPRIFGETLTDVLNSDDISFREKIYYFKKVGETLNQMSTIRKYTPLTEIFLNDLHESNFMVNRNNKQLYVVDLDSCKIAGNTAFQAKYLTPSAFLQHTPSKYRINTDESIPGYVTADESSDLYCYNIMILNFLYGSSVNNFTIPEFYSYLNYLHHIGVDNELLDYFNRLATNNRNKNPVNCLDSLTDEQICRARKNVYTKVMKK